MTIAVHFLVNNKKYSTNCFLKTGYFFSSQGLLKIGTDIRYQKNWLLDPYEESSAPSNNAQNEGTYSTESSLQGEESSVMPLDWENLAAWIKELIDIILRNTFLYIIKCLDIFSV